MSSHQTQTISQLTLIKFAPTSSKCKVYCDVNSCLQMFEFAVDGSTSVQNIISQTLQIVGKMLEKQGIQIEAENCQLYASRKSGRKVNDLPSLSSQQKILKTGVNRFYLEYKQKLEKKRTILGSLSTKSISSEIKIEKSSLIEKKAGKQLGCFCFS